MDREKKTMVCPGCGATLEELFPYRRYPRYHVYRCDTCGVTYEMTEDTPGDKNSMYKKIAKTLMPNPVFGEEGFSEFQMMRMFLTGASFGEMNEREKFADRLSDDAFERDIIS